MVLGLHVAVILVWFLAGVVFDGPVFYYDTNEDGMLLHYDKRVPCF